MKRMIDLATIRPHPRAGQPMVELHEFRGEVISSEEFSRRFSSSMVHADGLDRGSAWFVETVSRDGEETVVGLQVYDGQQPYSRWRQKVFEIEHRGRYDSLVGCYPDYEFEYAPLILRCDSCGADHLESKLDLRCDEDGVCATCSCGARLAVNDAYEETIEQAMARAGGPITTDGATIGRWNAELPEPPLS